MPGSTPNFAIPYPCGGETIDSTVFQDFADGVEAALLTVQTASNAALNRPRAATRTLTTGTSCAVAATTAMTFATVDYNSGLTATAAGFTIVSAGVYMVDAEFSPLTLVGNVTSFAGNVVRGATVMYRRKLGYFGGLTTAGQINISGLVSCAAANTIGAQWAWTGAGGPMFVYCRLSISKICDP